MCQPGGGLTLNFCNALIINTLNRGWVNIFRGVSSINTKYIFSHGENTEITAGKYRL